jgi:hypothetical protein
MPPRSKRLLAAGSRVLGSSGSRELEVMTLSKAETQRFAQVQFDLWDEVIFDAMADGKGKVRGAKLVEMWQEPGVIKAMKQDLSGEYQARQHEQYNMRREVHRMRLETLENDQRAADMKRELDHLQWQLAAAPLVAGMDSAPAQRPKSSSLIK